MPRPPRHTPAGVPQHVVQRGNNRCPMFAAPVDFRWFLDCLAAACRRHGCRLHAYALMTNHVHLLLTPRTDMSISRTMQAIGSRYVPYFNKRCPRTGTLWEGRYRAATVDSDRYVLECYRYIELNPVRAGMIADAAEYPWSSHATNAWGVIDPLVTPHPAYDALASEAHLRRGEYRALCAAGLDAERVRAIRRSVLPRPTSPKSVRV